MANEARLKIIIDALNMAKGELGTLQADLAGVETSSKKGASGLDSLKEGLSTVKDVMAGVAAGAAAFAVTWKVAMDLGKEGASINQLNASFAGLMGTEEAATEMERKLSEAVHGTMTGEQLRGAVLKMLTGAEGEFADKVKQSAPMLFEMAAASAKLNPVLGDTQSILMAMSQSLEMGTARGLKRYGIIVRQAEAEEQYASSIGKTRAQLDEEERKVALLNAALQYHDTLLRQVGGTVESMVDPFKRLETAVEETGDKIKTAFAPGLANAAEAAALLITWEDKLSTAVGDHEKVVRSTAKTYDEYLSEMNRTRALTGDYIIDEEGFATVVTDANSGLTQRVQVVGAVTRAEWELQQATKDTGTAIQTEMQATTQMNDAADLYADKHRMMADATATSRQAIQDTITAYSMLSITMAGPVGKENDAYSSKQTELAAKAAELKAELDKLEGSQGAVAKSEAKNVMSATDLALAHAKVTQATEDLNTATRKISTTKGQASETDAEFAVRVAQLRSEIEGQTDKMGKANQSVTSYVDNSKKIAEVKKAYDEANVAIEQNAQAHDDAAKRIMFDLLQQRAAVGGLTSDEMKALNDVALKWGLVDQSTHDAVSGIDSALAGLATGTSLDAFISQIDGIAAAANNANAAFQAMMLQQAGLHGGPGTAAPSSTPAASPAYALPAIHQAGGGDWMVNRPTLFMAGDDGPERATFTPQRGGNNTHYQYNTTQRAGDTIIIDDHRTGALFLEMQRRERRAAAEQSMG